MTDFFEQYENHIKEKGLSQNTLNSYLSDLRRFFKYCDAMAVEYVIQVETPFLNTFLDSMIKNGASNTSVNRMLSVLRSYFSFLKQNGHIAKDPTKGIKLLETRKKMPDFLNDREVALLCDFGKFYTPLEYRDTLMIYLCTHVGLNVSEVCSLNVADVNLNVGTVKVQGERARKVVIDDTALKRLEHYITTLRPVILNHSSQTNALFPSSGQKAISRQAFWKNLTIRCKTLKIKKHITPNSLKYSCMAKSIEEGIEPQTILDNMGYNDRSTLRKCSRALKEKYAKKSRKKIK